MDDAAGDAEKTSPSTIQPIKQENVEVSVSQETTNDTAPLCMFVIDFDMIVIVHAEIIRCISKCISKL